jgi:hypothetical protein
MGNIIREKVYVWPCKRVAAVRGEEQCDHRGFNLSPLLDGSFEYVTCPVGVVLTYRAANAYAKLCIGDADEPRRVVEFQHVSNADGQPYLCAWAIQKDGRPHHPCGKPTVYFQDEADDRILSWSQKDELLPQYAGACRIHTQTLSGMKVTNRETLSRDYPDFQRSRVYQWERGVFPDMFTLSMTLDECKELVERIWAAHAPAGWRVPQVQLAARKNAKGSCYAIERGITLAPSHLNPVVACHETAHALTHLAFEGHGPLFVRLYLELLERYAGETPEPAEDLKVASYEELAAVDNLRGFEIAEKAAA